MRFLTILLCTVWIYGCNSNKSKDKGAEETKAVETSANPEVEAATKEAEPAAQKQEAAIEKEVALKRFESASTEMIFKGASTASTLVVYMKDMLGINPELAKVTIEATYCQLGWGPNCVKVSVCANEECEGVKFIAYVYVGERDGGVQLVSAELDLDGTHLVTVGNAAEIDAERMVALKRNAPPASKERDKNGKCCCESMGDVSHYDYLTPEECGAPDMDGGCVALMECSVP